MAQVILITSTPGRVVADFSFQLYEGITAQSTAGLGVVEAPIDAFASNYSVTGVDDPLPGELWTLTYDDGLVRGVKRWPLYPSTPTYIILPIRVVGLTLADIDPHLFLDGAEVSLGTLALTSLGSPFDYYLSNVPAPSPGSVYSLQYSLGGVYSLETWPPMIAGLNTALGENQCPFIAEFHEWMNYTVLAQPGRTNNTGTFIPSGAALAIPCQIEGGPHRINDRAGREVVSSLQIFCGGYYNLTEDFHRYTVPSPPFTPSQSIKAIIIDKLTGEDPGVCYEVINLP